MHTAYALSQIIKQVFTFGNVKVDFDQKRGITFVGMAIILGGFSSILIFVLKDFVIYFYNISSSTKQMAIQMMNVTSFLVVFISVPPAFKDIKNTLFSSVLLNSSTNFSLSLDGVVPSIYE